MKIKTQPADQKDASIDKAIEKIEIISDDMRSSLDLLGEAIQLLGDYIERLGKEDIEQKDHDPTTKKQ